MSTPPAVAPRKASGVRVLITPGEQPPSGGLPIETGKENGTRAASTDTSVLNADREVEILNHCFDDVERFMSRLQQAAEAQGVINQRKKKGSRKSKKEKNNDDLLSLKALPPSEQDFVELFQKIKYSLCLLDRLKSSISQPDAPELLHHIFVPLSLMVKTTGGPALASSVVSPAMTRGAVSLLQNHLNEREKELWTSLGSNWTSSCLELDVSEPPYSPTFMDGWQPQAYDSAGQLLEDPIQVQHKQDYVREGGKTRQQQQAQSATDSHGGGTEDGNGLPPEGERLYCCSYDFVARNSSELSVLQGETLEVLESSKRWWKCRNRFEQIGFVPYNILEPLSALNKPEQDYQVVRRESKKTALIPRTKYFSYTPSSSDPSSPTHRSPMRVQSMVLPSTTIISGENDDDRVLIMNDELLQRLAARRESLHQPAAPRLSNTTASLNYHSPSAEVEAWLTEKGFSQPTIECLGILNGAQLFSLTKEELCTVTPEEGARVYSHIMVQKALLEDERKASELDAAMEKQKMKIDLK